ncbi:hypothetical protein KIPB_001013 [Kipferlia bialata]|uniref:Uncharacterized protein n=1 Tax=Kipferlia bialata TaxID=797122 RepID=A0A391P007_9EUKA|nr:hypothetical protein KIPB_001013 [Kipferlia bialata]|eukprot:g1013.t1
MNIVEKINQIVDRQTRVRQTPSPTPYTNRLCGFGFPYEDFDDEDLGKYWYAVALDLFGVHKTGTVTEAVRGSATFRDSDGEKERVE